MRGPLRPTLVLGLAVLILFTTMIILPIFRPGLGGYITIVAIGLAVALQKYVASFAGYFVLRFSKLFNTGDRIRIAGMKGDVRNIGLLHFILDEVGDGEKLGGELTGRIIHIPNHIVLDQPVLNFSQDFSVTGRFITSNFIFDEVRIPLNLQSDLSRAGILLTEVLREEDAPYVEEARKIFGNDVPNFLHELEQGPRTMLHVEAPQRAWLIGRFVAPLRGRNELKSRVIVRFMERIHVDEGIRVADK